MNNKSLTFPALLISLSLIVCAFIAAQEIRALNNSKQVIKVVGSAKRQLTSDLAVFTGTISSGGVTDSAALEALNNQKPPLYEFLEKRGFSKEIVQFSPPYENNLLEYDKNGRYTGNVIRYGYSQKFSLEHSDVEKVKALSLSINELLSQSVYAKVSSVQYFYTKLADVKVELQALAAADAKQRAVKIAASTQSTLGPIRGARMGVLQITPRNSTTVSDYGVNDTSTIEKEITAVVSATFQVS